MLLQSSKTTNFAGFSLSAQGGGRGGGGGAGAGRLTLGARPPPKKQWMLFAWLLKCIWHAARYAGAIKYSFSTCSFLREKSSGNGIS